MNSSPHRQVTPKYLPNNSETSSFQRSNVGTFPDTASMGTDPDGWMTDSFNASVEIYGALPADISDEQFVNLIAVLIAPSRQTLFPDNQALKQRARRIGKLLNGIFSPIDNLDVWFEQCA